MTSPQRWFLPLLLQKVENPSRYPSDFPPLRPRGKSKMLPSSNIFFLGRKIIFLVENIIVKKKVRPKDS